MAKKQDGAAQQLHKLFAGLDEAHGVYTPPKKDAPRDGKGKLNGRQGTERSAPTVDAWEQHLAGKRGLGVYPLRRDGTVRFAALDVDVYPLDHARLWLRIQESKLPLVLCKSKSGGAHLYLFGKQDLPAALVRQRLTQWAAVLGLPKYEVYPHKDALEGEQDIGKYLNMPYFKGDERPAVGEKGVELSLPDFLAATVQGAVTRKQLQELQPSLEEALVDGPPCLEALLQQGPVNDYRNNTLINLGVYLRQRYPDGWEGHLEEYNRKFLATPLEAREVVKVQRSLAKKTYNYSCQQEPIQPLCQSTVCIGRKFGVRAQAAANGQEVGFDLNLGTLKRFMTDPVTWELEVDGVTLRLTTPQLRSYQAFSDACLEYVGKFPPQLKQDTWRALVSDKLKHLETVDAPAESGRSGMMMWHLQKYCENHRAVRWEELKDGRAWWVPKGNGTRTIPEDRIYFRMPFFKVYLEKLRVLWSERELVSQFKAWGFTHHEYNIKGVFITAWALPPFAVQTEPDMVPRDEQRSAM